MKIKVLYVEDEPSLGKIVSETLVNRDFEVVWEQDGRNVMNLVRSFVPDICVLDIMLPNVDGYSLCKEICSNRPEIPVLFLTAKVETADLIRGFEAGGSDYVRKPFSLEELIARINNQLRLKAGLSGQVTPGQDIRVGRYMFYPQRYELHSPETIIKLSQREMQVLRLFTANINRVIDRKALLMEVWGDDSFFNSRNLDVYVRKIRQYFKDDESILIQTLKGKGYLFLVP